MAKPTQTHRLYQLMKTGEAIPVQKIADHLNIKYYSVAVYIHEMKAQFKANIKSVKDGRKVVAYQLIEDGKKLVVPEFRKGSYGPVPKARNPLASLADELESVNSGTVSEKEFADIRSSLGLGDFNVGGNGGDY